MEWNTHEVYTSTHMLRTSCCVVWIANGNVDGEMVWSVVVGDGCGLSYHTQVRINTNDESIIHSSACLPQSHPLQGEQQKFPIKGVNIFMMAHLLWSRRLIATQHCRSGLRATAFSSAKETHEAQNITVRTPPAITQLQDKKSSFGSTFREEEISAHFRIRAGTPGRPGNRRLGVLVFCDRVL